MKKQKRKFTQAERMQLIGLQKTWEAQWNVCKAIESAAMAITKEKNEYGRAGDFVSSDDTVERLEELLKYDVENKSNSNCFGTVRKGSK